MPYRRGSEDHGRHALCPVEHGVERSASRSLDPPAFAFLALPLAQPDELAVGDFAEAELLVTAIEQLQA